MTANDAMSLSKKSPRMSSKARYPKSKGTPQSKLFEAASLGKRSQLQKLLTSSDLGPDPINTRDQTSGERFNCLHYAVKEGRIKTCEFLIKSGISIDT